MFVAKPNVILVLGTPGSGKGTLCKKFHNRLGYIHVAFEESLVAYCKEPGAPLGPSKRLVCAFSDDSLPWTPCNSKDKHRLLVRLFKKAERRLGETFSKTYIIEDFPINEVEFESWNNGLAKWVNLRAVVYLDMPEKVSIERIKNSGTGEERASIKERFTNFNQFCSPILRYYLDKKMAVKINGGYPEEMVYDMAITFIVR